MTDKKVKVLIIEDDRDILRTTSFRLEKNGFETVTAENGRDGLNQVRRSRPDIILLDLLIPGINGYDVARNVKRDNSLRYIPLVIISARAEAREAVRKDLGAEGFVLKPFEPGELLAAVNDLTARRRESRKEDTDSRG